MRARQCAIRIDQINGIQELAATIALIPARFFKTAIWARPFDITVRQIALIGNGIDLLRDALLDKPIFFECEGEGLCQRARRFRG